MEPDKKIIILPLKEWKAVRTIEFRLYNVPCILQYYRGVDASRLERPKADPNNIIELAGELKLPQDELDLAMLEWVKSFDPAPTYRTQLLRCNIDESDASKRVDYLPHVSAEFISNPDFSGLTQEELLRLDGKEFTQFCMYVPIYTLGPLPYPQIRPTAIRHYSWAAQEKETDLINRIRKEISYSLL